MALALFTLLALRWMRLLVWDTIYTGPASNAVVVDRSETLKACRLKLHISLQKEISGQRTRHTVQVIPLLGGYRVSRKK